LGLLTSTSSSLSQRLDILPWLPPFTFPPVDVALPRRLIVGEQAGAEETEGGVGVEVSELVFESFTCWALNFNTN